MALAASGAFSTILERAKDSLAQCDAFQTWTGAATAAAAEAFVGEFEKRYTEEGIAAGRGVFAVISLEDARPLLGSVIWQGMVRFHFIAPVAAEYLNSPEEALREFNNNYAATLAELVADCYADTTGTLLALRPEDCRAEPAYMTAEQREGVDGTLMEADALVAVGPR